jgi:hypothetical protein
MSWDKTSIDLGDIKVGKSREFVYIYEGNGEIINSQVQCRSCSSSSYKGSVVSVIYRPKRIAKHLEYQGFQMINKSVKVTILLPDGKREHVDLFFKGKVIKKNK